MSSLNGEGPTPRSAWAAEKTARDMSLVEIAEQLERVTSWIEAERVKEREARAVYDAVRQAVEANIKDIRERAGALVQEQRRRMVSFDGLLGQRTPQAASMSEAKPQGRGSRGGKSAGEGGGSGKKNITDAILEIWDQERWHQPLTTDEIAEALEDVGYKTTAAPRSLKSAVNQSLAKLCRQGKVFKYRLDGTRISDRESGARARRYMSARASPEEDSQ
jgi:hypothetical protein